MNSQQANRHCKLLETSFCDDWKRGFRHSEQPFSRFTFLSKVYSAVCAFVEFVYISLRIFLVLTDKWNLKLTLPRLRLFSFLGVNNAIFTTANLILCSSSGPYILDTGVISCIPSILLCEFHKSTNTALAQPEFKAMFLKDLECRAICPKMFGTKLIAWSISIGPEWRSDLMQSVLNIACQLPQLGNIGECRPRNSNRYFL